MLTRLSLLSLLAVLVAIALANPPPTLTPAPTVPGPDLENRQFDSILSDASSLAVSVISVATSKVGQFGDIFTTVESVAGKYYTVVSSKGGSVITLGAGGVVTSIFGSKYTILAPGPSSGAALSLGLQTPLVVGLVTVMLSTLLGAIIVA